MSARVHQDALTTRPESYLRPGAIVSGVSAVLILLLRRKFGSRSTRLTLLGTVGVVANGFISARWEWPINAAINSWSAESVPEEYSAMRQTWDSRHAMRTVASIVALLCFIAAALSRQGE